MSQDLVKALGVRVFTVDISDPVIPDYDWQDVVLVKDLRAALEKMPVVYGFSDSEGNRFNDKKFPSDTHTARLFAIEEIKKEPVKVEFETHITRQGVHYYDTAKFDGKIGRKVKVTIQEIVGE